MPALSRSVNSNDDAQREVQRTAGADQRAGQLEIRTGLDEQPAVLLAEAEEPELVVPPAHDALARPIAEQPFVVVDLETAGGGPAHGGITEIGAVRVVGGRLEGTFSTLVNPGRPIPPLVAALTGITDDMVA